MMEEDWRYLRGERFDTVKALLKLITGGTPVSQWIIHNEETQNQPSAQVEIFQSKNGVCFRTIQDR